MYMCAIAERSRREEAYRRYVADSLRLAPQGMYIAQQYGETTGPRAEIDVEATVDYVISRLHSEVT